MSCKYIARDQPRALPNGDPCPKTHCIVCGHRHVDQYTCPTCVHEARDNLTQIERMADQLPREAEQQGIDSEAVHLAGPTANPSAWRQRRRYGYRDATETRRDGTTFRPDVIGEDHPLWTLSTWDLMTTEHLGHTRYTKVTISSAVGYLGTHLSDLAQDGDYPFADMARELRHCRAHLEDVLRDGEQRDTGAPCMRCHVPLERVWGANERADGWKCPRCHERSTEDQYQLAVRYAALEEAEWLTDADMSERLGVRAGTIRQWANRGSVRRRSSEGRTVYSVADAEAQTGA